MAGSRPDSDPTAGRRRLNPRGQVWIAVGILIEAVGLLTRYRIHLRGTGVPWGLLVIAFGLLLLFLDTRKQRG